MPEDTRPPLAQFLEQARHQSAAKSGRRGVSGSNPLSDRPEGKTLLDFLQPGDVILTSKLDRMFRSAPDALDVLASFKDRGISLHMLDLGSDVTGNGISKLVFTILSAVAEAERDRIRERVATVKADQRERGRFLGGTVPFGFTVRSDGSLQPGLDQQTAVQQMRIYAQEGVHSGRSLTQSRKLQAAICRMRRCARSWLDHN